MSRTFDGVNDEFICSTGALSGMTYGTIAVIFRCDDFGLASGLFNPHNSGGTFLGALDVTASTGNVKWFSNDGAQGPTISANIWYCLVARKATGTATARFSIFNYTTSAWAHQNADRTSINWASPGASGTIRHSFQSSDDFIDGDIAVRAAWANSLPWSADSTGDANIVATGLNFSLMGWINAAPSALWVLDQSDTTQKIVDLTGGGANQTSLTGTTVSADAVPSFGYGADLFETRTAPSTGLPPEVEGPENSSTMYSQGFGKG